MNEYTYKAKKLEDGEWTAGSLFAGVNNHLIIQSINLKENTFIGSLVDKDTICRLCPNGLYENDVFVAGGAVGLLRYGKHDDEFGFYIEWWDKDLMDEDAEIVLVGNIIDNPNLVNEVLEYLKEEKKEKH
jgi:hypothetical protein